MQDVYLIVQVIATLSGAGDMFNSFEISNVGNTNKHATLEACNQELASLMSKQFKMVYYDNNLTLSQQIPEHKIFANLQCV